MAGADTMGSQPETVFALRRQARLVRIDRATAALMDAMTTAGLRSMVLKGPTTARLLFPGEERVYSDIDLLVEPGALDAAEEVANSLGFRPRPAPNGRLKAFLWRALEAEERTFDRDRDEVTLDLHRSFHQFRVNFNLLEALWPNREEMPLAHSSVVVPDIVSIVLLTVLHATGANHPRSNRTRLLDDLDRTLKTVSDDVWHGLRARAHALGVAPDVVAVLRECGGAQGTRIADTAFAGINADRVVVAHLRTGSLAAYQLRRIRMFSWPQRLLWCLMPLAPRLRPTASVSSHAPAAGSGSRWWLAKDVWSLVRVAITG